MFHFPTFPPHALCVQARVTPHDWCGVPPFGNPRINARLTAPRGLSQPPTSFIGSWCQGIHRVPLTTWPHKKPTPRPLKGCPERVPTRTLSYRVRRCSRPLCSSQRTTSHHPAAPAGPAHPSRLRRYKNGMALTEKKRSTGHPEARSLRTQQRAYSPVLRAIRVPHATPPEGQGDAVLGTDRSRRPNWSAFHPRALPRT